jgi:GTP cyclohydrolase II
MSPTHDSTVTAHPLTPPRNQQGKPAQEFTMSTPLPFYVHLNFAVRHNADGTLSYGLGTSCFADLQRCHQLRETHAIAVGANTFRRERPRLTARREYLGREPVMQRQRIVITRSNIPDLPPGIIQLSCPDGNLRAGLSSLGLRGIHSVFVEGGPTLHRELLTQGLVNAATVYVRGDRPQDALAGLFNLLPGLPIDFRIRPLGEGHLVQFNFLPPVLDPHIEAQCYLPSQYGDFRMHVFEDPALGVEHAILVLGHPELSVETESPPLVRIHSSCWTGDLFGSKRCDCGQQLQAALRAIQNEREGALVYLNQEGRGIGLRAKALAYTYQQEGLNTFEANRRLGLPDEARDFSFAAHQLKLLGIRRLRLLTNNPDKVRVLRGSGIEVAALVALGGAVNEINRRYLEAKVERGHNPVLLS